MATDNQNGQMDFSSSLPHLNEFINQIKSLTDSLRTYQTAVQNTVVGNQQFNQSTQQMNGTMNNLRRNANQTSKSMRQVSEQTRRMQDAVLNFNKHGTGTVNLLQKFHTWINNLKFGVEGLLLAFGGKKAWDFLIGTNMEVETLQRSLEVTLKSAERAAETVRMLRSYAALTPFDEIETFQAGEMFASNRMDVERWVRIAGDLTSAKKTAGVELKDVVNVLTRINSGDFGKAMIRLRQMGISLQELKAKGLEFTKNNTFLGTSDEMLHAVERIVEERYGGLTTTLGQTVKGLLSTIEDYFLQIGIEMGDESFKQLKDFLLASRDQLDDFRNSTQFKEIVSDFNYLKDEVIEGLKPWIATIKALLGIVLKNLPLIGTMMKTYFQFQFAKTVADVLQKSVSFLINMANNWSLVTRATNYQNQLLLQQYNLQNKQNLGLSTQLMLLSKINAMRALGNQYATEQLASEAAATAMMRSGAMKGTSSRIADTFANSSSSAGTAATTATVAGTAAAGNAAAGTAAASGGALAKLASAVPVLLASVGIIVSIGAAIKGIITILTPNQYDLKRTTNDYERIMGAQSEEIETLESLNSQRQYNNELIKYHSNVVGQHTDEVDELNKELKKQTQLYKEGKTTEEAVVQTKQKLKQSEENLRKSRNELNNVTDELIRRHERMLEVAPELSQQLIDENGHIQSNTEAFERNTKSIQNNIDTRKRQLSNTFYEQMSVAETEKKRALNEIDTLQQTINLIQGNEGTMFENPFARLFASTASTIRGFFVQDDTQKVAEAGLKALKYDKEGRDLAVSDLYHQMYELQNSIRTLDDTMSDQEDMIRKGYYMKDSEGNAVLDDQGRYIVDVSRYQQNVEREESLRTKDLREGDVDASDLEERLQSVSVDVERIKNKYTVKLNQLLTEGYEKDSSTYENMEQTMYQELADYWNEQHQDFLALKEQFEASVQAVINEAPQELRQMLIDGIGIDQMIDVVETIRNTGAFAIDTEMKKYLTDLQKIADSDIVNLDVFTSAFENYATKMEIRNKYDDIEYKILKEKTDALVSKMGKDKKTKDLLSQFNNKWENQRRMLEAEKDIILSNDELAGREPGSAIYNRHFKEQNLRIREFMFAEMDALKKLIPSLSEENRYKAQLQMLKLQKESNDLLLAIKENTSSIGEFNRPDSVKAITWYDYQMSQQGGGGVEIGNAEFSMTVEGPLTSEDIEQTLEAYTEFAQKKYGKNIKRIQNSGIKNPKITGIT